MRPTLVDSNVVLDVAQSDPEWKSWSTAAIRLCLDESILVINPIIYAEVSIGYRTIEQVERVFPADLYHREPLPYDAAFLAEKCILTYRRRGGRRTSPLPDFDIGAHAAVRGYRLLTRDVARYQTYFPTVELIAP
jgi:predicted nucleic acid-binding protein